MQRSDLQSVPLLLMPLLHLLELHIQTPGGLPEPHALLLIILDLRWGDSVTSLIRPNLA